ncbi:hypothetical protein [Thalassospira lucentensis]|uniref:hypothetical protein n=1 Tax=Thalassospira lucentensis TaxID=168935 RepID=UPI003AA87A6A
MALDSAPFLFIFLPVLVLLFHACCGRASSLSVALLPLASVIYCALIDPRTLPLLTAMILLNYGLVQAILRTPAGATVRAVLTTIGLIISLAPLVLYKLDGGDGFGLMRPDGAGSQQLVPLGLAFYSLQQITYLIDAQKNTTLKLSFVRHLAWSSLFCQLPAGPIAPYGTMAPQYADLGKSRPAALDTLKGLSLVLFGLLKKTLIAAPLGHMITPLYRSAETGSIHSIDAFTAMWGFMLELYFNFSAFSDIAIGLALCFGLRLPVNFNSPLQARDLGDYVARWHMSMMHFVRTYVFVPVFQLLARCLNARMSLSLWAVATIISFSAMGAWHSLSFTMISVWVIWACGLVGFQTYRSSRIYKRKAQEKLILGRFFKVFNILFLLFMMSVTATWYRADSFDGFSTIVSGLFGFGPSTSMIISVPRLMFFLAPITLLTLACPNTMQIFGLISGKPSLLMRALTWRPNRSWGLLTGIAGVVFLLMILSSGAEKGDFIYARF